MGGAALPGGRRGQALALALLLVILGLVWLSAVAPALAWYADRAELLSQQQVLAARMARVAASVPTLQRELAQSGATLPALAVLPGATDAVAGAALQQAVQDMATRAGATVSSAEVLPAEAVASYRRIGLHVTVSGSWPVLVTLLRAVAEATPRMLVDDLSLRPAMALAQTDARPLEASFTAIAFRAPVLP